MTTIQILLLIYGASCLIASTLILIHHGKKVTVIQSFIVGILIPLETLILILNSFLWIFGLRIKYGVEVVQPYEEDNGSDNDPDDKE